MRPPRGLSASEAALWARLAQTVHPLPGKQLAKLELAKPSTGLPPRKLKAAKPIIAAKVMPQAALVPATRPRPQSLDQHGLDSSWERKLAKAAIAPDFTLDLHGYGLDAAHDRLDQGLSLALSQGARMVLVIAGRARPVDAADRGSRRGAIRAKLLDWLAAGPHGSKIAAVRPAHPCHGGAGAVYVVLRRAR